MKLPPLTNALPSILPALGGELLSPSLPNSVCKRKKTSLSGWLPLPYTLHYSLHHSFYSTPPSFTLLSFPQLHYSNSK